MLSKKDGGVTVSFNVNYVYNTDKTEKDLKNGENIFDFIPDAGRSHVNGKTVESEDGDVVRSYTGRTGVIKESGKKK